MNRLFVVGLALAFASAFGGSPDSDDGFGGLGDDDNDEQFNLPTGPQPQVSLVQQQQPASPAPAAAAVQAPPQAPAAPPPPASAHEAAKVARQAARTANRVARHSKRIIGHSKKALGHALHALHEARVDSKGLKKRQKTQLKKAEAHLREATKKAEYGKLKYLEDGLNAKEEVSEKEQMLREIRALRKELDAKNIDDPEITKALDDLEADVEKSDTVSDESKAELERLKQLVNSLEKEETEKEEKEAAEVKVEEEESDGAALEGDVTPVQEKGLDIDTQMPYGDLEPFGREDTAQELTESSVKESDEMVDQLERAEVAEEKRAVFRALTRLRGAAITSFDGVARSQTGNIDEYNKVHQWRTTHPLHHLADEESDVSKWAFPDNAD